MLHVISPLCETVLAAVVPFCFGWWGGKLFSGLPDELHPLCAFTGRTARELLISRVAESTLEERQA